MLDCIVLKIAAHTQQTKKKSRTFECRNSISRCTSTLQYVKFYKGALLECVCSKPAFLFLPQPTDLF